MANSVLDESQDEVLNDSQNKLQHLPDFNSAKEHLNVEASCMPHNGKAQGHAEDEEVEIDNSDLDECFNNFHEKDRNAQGPDLLPKAPQKRAKLAYANAEMRRLTNRIGNFRRKLRQKTVILHSRTSDLARTGAQRELDAVVEEMSKEKEKLRKVKEMERAKYYKEAFGDSEHSTEC